MKKIKLFESFQNEEIFSKQFSDFLLIVGKKSEDIFTFFNVDEMHGLSRIGAQNKKDTKDSAYIAGLCNEFPNDPSKTFLFLNSIRFNGDFRDYLLVMHETMHLSFEVIGRNVENDEEEIITWGEETAIKICELLKSNGLFQ